VVLALRAHFFPASRLTAEERSRNIPGDMLVFEYAAGRHEPEHCASDLPQHFASVAMAHSICRHVPVRGTLYKCVTTVMIVG
jgi:hypothetical protein